MGVGIDAPRYGQAYKIEIGKHLLAGLCIASTEHDAADFHTANRSRAIEGYDQGLSRELDLRYVREKLLRIDIDRVPPNRPNDGNAQRGEAVAKSPHLGHPEGQLLLIHDLPQTTGDPFEIATSQPHSVCI